MATSLLLMACVIFAYILPCFSNPCPSPTSPTPLPCNSSIQISPPFYFQSDDYNTTNPTCEGHIKIVCGIDGPFLDWDGLVLLKNISYNPNIMTVQVPDLSDSLKESGCDNIYINFSTPVNDFSNEMQHSLNTSLSSLTCKPPYQIQSPPQLFGKDYNISDSPSYGGKYCLRQEDSDPIFELILLFENNSPKLSLQSAIYSSDLVAQPRCFTNWTGVLCEGCKERTRRRIITVSTVAVPLIIIIVFLLTIVKIRRYGSYKKNKAQENIESIIKQHGSFAPKRYRYAELKEITNSFTDELGKGGFGRVFKGSLRNGCSVAVKILHGSSHSGEEFVNEVVSIGRTSHTNIVALLGFCIDKSNHALIYEYMPNGSLDKYIYSENPKANLGWEKLHVIAVGVARGLEYLHRGCGTRIVHFDIKPQNILLDEDFCPKIADFGLAKLCPPKESIVSLAEMRGTIGYIAPEVFSRSFGVVSTKSDVYSYGMMVLEMVGGRRNSTPCIENSSQAYFPHWLHNRLVEGTEIELCGVTTETEKIARKMALIGLWCSQTSPVNRPLMGRVLEMFERSLDELELPPKPLLASPPHDMMASIHSSSRI